MLNLFTEFTLYECLPCFAFKLSETTWLDVTPSKAGKLELKLTRKFAFFFFQNIIWLGLNPFIFFREFLAAVTHATG